MGEIYNFKRQLDRGLKVEKCFYAVWDDMQPHGKKEYDFDTISGDRLELKSEWNWELYDGPRNPSKNQTPNFFIERYSKIEGKIPGGPWQSITNGATHLVQFFVRNELAFIFNLSKFVPFLDSYLYTHNPRLIEIKNEGWVTGGHAIHWKVLKPYYIKYIRVPLTDELRKELDNGYGQRKTY